MDEKILLQKIAEVDWSTPETLVLKGGAVKRDDFILKAIQAGSVEVLANQLNCGTTTVNRFLRKNFPYLSRATLSNKFLEFLSLKVCSTCKNLKPFSEFSKNRAKTFGLAGECKSCKNTRRRKDYADNTDKYSNYYKNYKRKNPEKYREYTAKYAAKKKERIPAWADLDKIKDFYNNCPEGYEVDHIIPLQGEKVSGLHIVTNLQYLAPSNNRSKGNKFVD